MKQEQGRAIRRTLERSCSPEQRESRRLETGCDESLLSISMCEEEGGEISSDIGSLKWLLSEN